MKQNWEYKKLTDVCSIQYGYPFESGNFTNEANGMPLIRIRDVKDGQTETYYEGPYPAEYIVHKGEYLIGMDGEFNIAPWKSDDALLNQRVCKITAKEGVFVGFLYRFLIKELKRIEDETPFVTVKHLSAKRLNQVTLPVPPLSVQSRIVAELDLLTGIIDKQNAQLKELDNLAQAIFYDMFGDPIENPKGWEVQLLKQHTTKIGSGATPKGGNESYKSEGIPLIRSLNVYNGTFKYKDLAHIDENQAAALDNVILQGGDVLLNITGASVARCCIVPCDLVSGRVNQHVAILRPKDSLKSVFLCAQLISSGYQQKLLHDSKANGATREALTKSQLEGLPIIVPPLALQQSFAEKIQSIEKQKETIRASIADTQKLLDYTMDKYFG